MTNTVANQPTAVALQATDLLLGWQSAQSPPTRSVQVSELAAYYLLLSTGGTITGPVTLSSSGSGFNLTLTGAAGNPRQVVFQTAAATRWSEGADGSTESGSNSGSNYNLSRYADNGTLIDVPLGIDRATGVATFSQPPAFASLGGATQGWVEIATYTVSSAATQAIPLSSSFRRFRLTMSGMSVSVSDAALAIQFSSNGGSSFYSSNYTTVIVGGDSSSNTIVGGTASGGGIYASGSLNNDAGGSAWDGVIEINPGTASIAPYGHGRGFGVGPSVYSAVTFGGRWLGSPVAMNYMQVYPNSGGTFSGILILEGLP